MARAFSIQFKKKNNPQKIYERTNIGKESNLKGLTGFNWGV